MKSPACIRRLNVCLRRQGVRQRLVRRILAAQICLGGLALALGLVVWPLTVWIFWFGAGAMLFVWNFLRLTKLVPQFMLKPYTSATGAGLFIRSQVRLLFVVAVGGVCVAFLGAPVGALLTGFSMMLGVIVWGVFASGNRRPAGS